MSHSFMHNTHNVSSTTAALTVPSCNDIQGKSTGGPHNSLNASAECSAETPRSTSVPDGQFPCGPSDAAHGTKEPRMANAWTAEPAAAIPLRSENPSQCAHLLHAAKHAPCVTARQQRQQHLQQQTACNAFQRANWILSNWDLAVKVRQECYWKDLHRVLTR